MAGEPALDKPLACEGEDLTVFTFMSFLGGQERTKEAHQRRRIQQRRWITP